MRHSRSGLRLLVLSILLIVFSMVIAGEALAIVPPYVINATDGGHCNLIGTWDGASKTCTLNQDISLSSEGTASLPILIDINNADGYGITIDGAGHTISGINDTGTGIQSLEGDALYIKNLHFQDLYYGVSLSSSTADTVIDCTFSDGKYGIFMTLGSGSGYVARNEFSGNTYHDIVLQDLTGAMVYLNDFFDGDNISLNNADNDIIFNNNFLNPSGSSLIYVTLTSTGNSYNFSSYGGNYWEAHSRPGQGCANVNNDRFCDAAYVYTAGPPSVIDYAPLTWQKSYFSWYDSASPGAQNWVLMANPDDPLHLDAWYELFIAGIKQTLPVVANKNEGEVPTFQAVAPKYPGTIGGPVEVDYRGRSLVSQRTLWAGNSMEEVISTDAADLHDHYYWTWYDQLSPGYKNWVLVANPKSVPVYYAVSIAGTIRSSTNGELPVGLLQPGEMATPQFDGVMGGPVEVQAWSDGVGGVVPANVIASQRVLSNGDTAFNEVPGIPANKLTDDYVWSWYDETSPGASNWVLIANPMPAGSPGDMYYEIWIAGEKVCEDGANIFLPPGGVKCPAKIDQGAWDGPIAPSQNIALRFDRQGGPVEVKTFLDPTHLTPMDSIASQRVTWGPSFEEVPGYRKTSLAHDYFWTWYDQQSPGMTNWVVVASPPGSVAVAAYHIKVGGVDVLPGNTDFIYPGDVKSYTFPGTMNGPVEVVADNDVIATQRVVYNGYFNEVMGTVLP